MKIGRKEPCTCGSEIKNKKCRGSHSPQTPLGAYINNNRKWIEEHVMKDGDMLFYGSLCNEIDEIPQEILWRELRRIAEIYLDSQIDRTASLHEMVDRQIEQLTERDKRFGYEMPFCHKGCSNCCQELVYCTDEEAEGILDYCNKNNVEICYEKITRQLYYVEFDDNHNHTGVTSWNNQDDKDQSCVFLNNIDGSCNIWPVRPLVCRVHLAEKTDQYCKPCNGVEDDNACGINYIELSYILSVVFTIHRDSIKKTMGKLLMSLRK